MSEEPADKNQEVITAAAPPQRTSSTPGYHQLLVVTQPNWLPIAASSAGVLQAPSMEQSTAGASGAASPKKKKERGAPKGKSVVVLKPCDVVERGGTVFMPNTIEMAKLKKEDMGQFRTNVQFSSKMSDNDIKRKIVETFPFLEGQRFYCAAAADNRTRLHFHGERRIWDGRFLKQKINGNSALYIFAEEMSTAIATAAATTTTTATATACPSMAIETQPTQDAFHTSSVCETQAPRASYEGYYQSSKKRRTTQNVSQHPKSYSVNRERRKRSHNMTLSHSVPASVLYPVASDQQSVEQPMSMVTGAITDSSMLAAQMENLRFRENSASGERVENGVKSRQNIQFLPTEEISELGGQPDKAWNLCASPCSFNGEQSYQQTLNHLYQDRIGLSYQDLDIPLNRQQDMASIADSRAQGLTEGSDQYNTSSDINPTSSGICSDNDALVSSDHSNSETKHDLEPKIDPNQVPFYKGADVFLVIFEHPPPSEVQSGRAIFESLGVVLLRRLNDHTFLGRRMPAASRPCTVKVSVESESGIPMGETKVDYIDDPSIYPIVLRHLASKYDGSNGYGYAHGSNSANGERPNGNTQGDTGSSGNGGFAQQLQSLQCLVNAAVASGAQWFVEPIFKSSAGRMLLDSYKESSQLPEVIAKKNGHEETAKFLEDITKRLSEREFFPDVQKIDWSELVSLVERTQEQSKDGIAVDQENYQAKSDLTIDTGYFGDIDTSSGNLSLQSKSDSDDDNSEISFEDSFEEDETQLKIEMYSDEKAYSSSVDFSDVNVPTEGLESPLIDGDISIREDEDSIMRRPFDQAVHLSCPSAFKIWVLNCLYRPTRKRLFVYVADRNDVSPPESWFEDEDCELWIESSNWQRCSDNSFIEQVNRIQEQSVLETASPVAKSYKQQPVAELQEQLNFNSVLQLEKIETLFEKMERWSLDNSADSNLVAKLVKSEGKVSTIQENMAAELQASPTQDGMVSGIVSPCQDEKRNARSPNYSSDDYSDEEENQRSSSDSPSDYSDVVVGFWKRIKGMDGKKHVNQKKVRYPSFTSDADADEKENDPPSFSLPSVISSDEVLDKKGSKDEVRNQAFSPSCENVQCSAESSSSAYTKHIEEKENARRVEKAKPYYVFFPDYKRLGTMRIESTGKESIFDMVTSRFRTSGVKNCKPQFENMVFLNSNDECLNIGPPAGVLSTKETYKCFFKKDLVFQPSDFKRKYAVEDYNSNWKLGHFFVSFSSIARGISLFSAIVHTRMQVDFFDNETLFESLVRDGRFNEENLRCCVVNQDRIPLSYKAEHFQGKCIEIRALKEKDTNLPESVLPQLHPDPFINTATVTPSKVKQESTSGVSSSSLISLTPLDASTPWPTSMPVESRKNSGQCVELTFNNGCKELKVNM